MHNDNFATVCAIDRNDVGGDGHMLEKLQKNKHVSLLCMCAYKYMKVGCLYCPLVNS
jgi:hypothetical protein